jgi:hypothetical protein
MAFVGRTKELDRLSRWLNQGEHFILITGPGGMGKTRLAIEAIRRHAQSSGQLAQVDCRVPTDDDALLSLVATTLGLGAAAADGAAMLRARIVQSLNARPRHLLFDSAEMISTTSWKAMAALGAQCPTSVFWLTSRDVPGFAVKAHLALGSLPNEEGIAFLVAHAPEQARSGLDTQDMANLVRTLGGVPLALELAASRLLLFSPQQLTERVGARLDVMSRKRGADADRHHSLKAVLAESWQRLSPEAQDLALHLQVFAAPLAQKQILALAKAAKIHQAQSALDELLRYAVIGPAAAAMRGPDTAHEFRLAFLRTTQIFIGEIFDSLAAKDQEAITRIHRAFVLKNLENAAVHLEAAFLQEAYDLCVHLADDARKIFHAVLDSDPILAARLFIALHPVVSQRVPGPAHQKMLDAAWSAIQRVDADLYKARLSAIRCEILYRTGQIKVVAAAAEEHAELLAALAQKGKEPQVDRQAIQVAFFKGMTLRSAGDKAAFEKHALATVRAARMTESPRLIRDALIQRAYAAEAMKRPRAIAKAMREVESLLADEKDPDRLAGTWIHLAILGKFEIPAEKVVGHFSRSIEESIRGGNPRLEILARGNLSLFLVNQGRYQEALDLLVSIQARARAFSMDHFTDRIRGDLAVIEILMGMHERAALALEAATQKMEEAGQTQILTLYRSFHAVAEAALGNTDAANTLAAQALKTAEEIGGATHLIARTNAQSVALLEIHHRGATPKDNGQKRRQRIEEAEGLLLEGETATSHGRGVLGPHALRILKRTLALAQPHRWLRVDEEKKALYVGAEPPIHFEAHPLRWALFMCLAEHRIFSPGQVVALDTIFESVWQGQSAAPRSRNNRIRVLVAHLREAGLKEAIVTRRGGYAINVEMELDAPELTRARFETLRV